MSDDPQIMQEISPEDDRGVDEEVAAGAIPLSDPDITEAELAAVDAVMRSPRLSSGPVAEAFEAAFGAYLGKKYAIAFPAGR